jgi:hypothetical protein
MDTTRRVCDAYQDNAEERELLTGQGFSMNRFLKDNSRFSLLRKPSKKCLFALEFGCIFDTHGFVEPCVSGA